MNRNILFVRCLIVDAELLLCTQTSRRPDGPFTFGTRKVAKKVCAKKIGRFPTSLEIFGSNKTVYASTSLLSTARKVAILLPTSIVNSRNLEINFFRANHFRRKTLSVQEVTDLKKTAASNDERFLK